MGVQVCITIVDVKTSLIVNIFVRSLLIVIYNYFCEHFFKFYRVFSHACFSTLVTHIYKEENECDCRLVIIELSLNFFVYDYSIPLEVREAYIYTQ